MACRRHLEQRSHRAAVRSKQAEPGEVKAAAVAAELAGGDGSGRSSIARGGGRRRCNRRWAQASNLLKPVAGGRRGPVPASSKRRQADGLGARAAARRRWWWSAAGSGHRACGDNDDEQRRAEKQPSGDGAEASMASDPRCRRWPDPGQLGLGRRGSRPVAGLGAGEVEVAGSRGCDVAGLRPSIALVK